MLAHIDKGMGSTPTGQPRYADSTAGARRKASGALLVTILALTGCAASSDPAQTLFSSDQSGGINHAQTLYRDELSTLRGKCTEDPAELVRLVNNSEDDLNQHGMWIEDRLALLQHLDQSIPHGSTVNCGGILAALLVITEGGK
jgi:hypothetical protein